VAEEITEDRPFGLTIPDGMVWQYQQTLRGGRLQHTWLLKGEAGAIHVDAWVSPCLAPYPAEWAGGIEMHRPCEAENAHHEHCWALGGPCQHDGSSLQFSEQIAPYLNYTDAPDAHVMRLEDHQRVLSIMRHRYGIWLAESSHD
jgi:hypothetical protein